jgi:hypothetical protein
MSKRTVVTHAVIPDVQSRPDVNTDHLRHVGNYLAEKRPDTIVCLGDFSDMVSLNSYAVGKAESEGRRYADDIADAKRSMNKLLTPVRKVLRYVPSMHLTMGNHEYRIKREAETNPKLIGTIAMGDLGYREAGWTVHDFLKVARLDGIDYSHYFVSGAMGRPVSSAAALLRTRQSSAIMGHVQRVDMAVHPFTQNIALFAGTCYTHDEGYLGPQGNHCKRGIWMLHEVHDGTYDPMFVSLDFLKRRYS